MLAKFQTSSLFNNSLTLFICLFIFVAGLTAGICFGKIMDVADKIHLSTIICDHIAVEAPNTSNIPGLIINIFLLALVFLAGFTIYGFPVSILVLLFRAFSAGLCGSLLIYNIETIGFSGFTAGYLLPNAFLCLIYLLAVYICINYAAAMVPHQKYKTDRLDRSEINLHYIFTFAVLAALSIITSFFL